MKVIGCVADLAPGAEIITGRHLELRVIVIRHITEEEARESAESLGEPLVIVPGERFYEVEITTTPIGSRN